MKSETFKKLKKAAIRAFRVLDNHQSPAWERNEAAERLREALQDIFFEDGKNSTGHTGMTIAGNGAAELGALMLEQWKTKGGIYPDGNPNSGAKPSQPNPTTRPGAGE